LLRIAEPGNERGKQSAWLSNPNEPFYDLLRRAYKIRQSQECNRHNGICHQNQHLQDELTINFGGGRTLPQAANHETTITPEFERAD
jgi:hypothetical protein